MTTFETAKSVVTVLTMIASISMRFGPLPDFWWIYKHKTTGQVQLLPVLAMGTNSAFVIMYAEAIRDYLPVMATNIWGVFVTFVLSAFYHHYTPDRPAIYKLWAICSALVIIVGIYSVLALEGVTNQTRDQVSNVLGWVTIFSTGFLYLSPLATIKRVLQTKDAASIPFGFCLLNTINAALWLIYSTMVSEWFIFAPNALGVPLGIIQIVLWIMYRPTTLDVKKTPAAIPADAIVRESLSIEIVPTPRSGLERIPSAVTNDNFVELVTPRKESLDKSPCINI